jgi:hypothetical protein
MKMSDWKDTAELIGIAAIVASLIFVGLQMKQSQDIAIADQYQERANTAIDYYLAHMAEPAVSDRGRRMIDGGYYDDYPADVQEYVSELTPEAMALAYLRFRTSMNLQDNNYFQYESGFMTEEAWQAQLSRFQKLFSNRLFAETYKMEKEEYRKSFQELCDEILAGTVRDRASD